MLAREYAKACYELLDENFLSDYQSFLLGLRENTDYYKLMASTKLSKSAKKDLLSKLVNGRLLNLFKVLIDNNRFYLVEDIYKELEKLDDDAKNIMRIEVVSKAILNQELQDLIKERLANKFKKAIILNIKNDDSLIDGIKIMYQGKLIDDTILNNLLKMKKMLKEVS